YVLWDAQEGTELKAETNPKTALAALAVSPSGKDVVSTSPLARYELGGDNRKAPSVLGQIHTEVTMTLVPDGKHVATRSGEQVTLWDTGTGVPQKTLKLPLGELVYAPSGKLVAVFRRGAPQDVFLCDTQTGEKVRD